MVGEGRLPRRTFLTLGLALTLFGCLLAAIAIVLPSWQVVELSEFNAIHEHGVFYDCVRSDTVALKSLKFSQRDVNGGENEQESFEADTSVLPPPVDGHNEATASRARVCTSKMDTGAESATWTMRMAVEEGDPAARELLLHRFLPQHKAVVFFFVFSLVFALISLVVGACSECFVPNGVLHVLSLSLAMCCSVLGDVIFYVATRRENSRHIYGLNNNIYEQHVSWAFYVHAAGSATLCGATFCALVAAYLLVRRELSSQRLRSFKLSKKSAPYVCTAFVDAEKMALPNVFGGGGASYAVGVAGVSPGASFDASMSAAPSRHPSIGFGGTFFPATETPHILSGRHDNCALCNGAAVGSAEQSWQAGSARLLTPGDALSLPAPPPAPTSPSPSLKRTRQQLRVALDNSADGGATTTAAVVGVPPMAPKLSLPAAENERAARILIGEV